MRPCLELIHSSQASLWREMLASLLRSAAMRGWVPTCVGVTCQLLRMACKCVHTCLCLVCRMCRVCASQPDLMHARALPGFGWILCAWLNISLHPPSKRAASYWRPARG